LDTSDVAPHPQRRGAPSVPSRALTKAGRFEDNARMRFAVGAFFIFVLVSSAHAQCGTSELGSGQIGSIGEDGTLRLSDGRDVRLAGIEIGPGARSLLLALTQDRMIALKAAADPAVDRYGRLSVFVTRNEDAATLQEALLAAGAARVSARVGSQACADRLLAVERQARQGRRGLWSDPNFAPLQAEPGPWNQRELGHFVLVEGKVASVRQSGGVIYVNFGRRWTRDFSLIIPRRLQGAFRAAGRDPQSLAGARLRVRGWLERRLGPVIEAAAPEQIERLE
jgi:endonuclease YncB( thermonuclease family)